MTFSHYDEFGGKRIDATLVPGSTCVNSILTARNFKYANSTHSRLFRFAAAREHCRMVPDNCESGHRVQAFHAMTPSGALGARQGSDRYSDRQHADFKSHDD